MAPLSLKIILDNGAVTRMVKFNTHTTVRDAHEIVKEKVHVPDNSKEYALFLRSADDDKSGVWLEGHRPLDYYMLRDGDSLDYICKSRNLRVKMLDGSVKTLQVDESKPVRELMMTICARIGITNYDEYGLCHDAMEEAEESKPGKEAPTTGTLTLKRKAQQKERDVALEQLSRKLKTDDNVAWLDQHRTLRELGVDATETVLLKRRLYYSDRNVDSRDPVQLNLLYVQTRDAILNGRHPVTEEQAADCKVRWINIRDVYRRILRKSLNGLSDQPRKTYKYENELKFLKPFYKDIFDSLNNEEEHDQDEEEKHPGQLEDDMSENNAEHDIPEAIYSDDSEKPLKKIKTKRRKYRKRKHTYDEETPASTSIIETSNAELDPTDTVDAFLLSIGATLKTFSPYHLNVAKTKIFSVVQDHDLRQIVEKEQNQLSDVKVSASDAIYLQQCSE